MGLYDKMLNRQEKLAVIGLGYVGLPLAVAFSKQVETIGFDINERKLNDYVNGIDPTNEIGEEVKNASIIFTSNESMLKKAKFFIVAVPTPIHKDKKPDLTPVTRACVIIGRNMPKGSIVVFESTVYPGVTEDICVPVLERESGLVCGVDFKVGYSPERINPGDKVHSLNNIVKIVSGIDEETLHEIAQMYELVIEAGVHCAKSIKVAEAAKLVENAQRDINIAFMNELAIAFDKMKINTKEVLDAMNTKWNALNFSPGLVGGHCIGVDPYYFIYEAERLGYHSQIISAGRKINDGMGEYIANIIVRELVKANKLVKQANIYILGITFKENCGDIRNSKVADIIKKLGEYGIQIKVVDPVVNKEEAKIFYGVDVIPLEEVNNADAVVFAVAHEEFISITNQQLYHMFAPIPMEEKVIIDIKSIFDKEQMCGLGYSYWNL